MPEPVIRPFVDIANPHTELPLSKPYFSKPLFASRHENKNMTYYEVGKLAFELLPILLSRIEALEGPGTHDITVCLRSHPPFYLIKNDLLQLEKAKAAQAIEGFLEVRFLSVFVSGPYRFEPDRNKAVYPCLFCYLTHLLWRV